VLLASFYFPPVAAVGGLRISRFARVLPEYGWTPVILTSRNYEIEQGLDPARMDGLENVTIIRTGEFPRIGSSLRRFLARLRPAAMSWPGSPEHGTVAAAEERPGETRRESIKDRLKRWVISLVVLMPDDKKHWSARAAVTAIRTIWQRRITCVVTSGPPFSTHGIGLLAKAFTGARWVADFRDPWVDMLPERFPHTRSAFSDHLERWLERLVVYAADAVSVTTPRMRDAFVARYPRVSRERFVVIPNSIDTQRFAGTRPADRYVPLTITYAGSMYFDRSPEALFRAVSTLIDDRSIDPRAIRIKLLGRCDTSRNRSTAALVRQYGLQRVVELVGPVPYPEALEIMQRSHLLLVLAPERHRLVVPAKVYDYLGSGSSLLAIAEAGATADLIGETASGRCFSESDGPGLVSYLRTLLATGSFHDLRNDAAHFSRYDARAVTERLVAHMSAPQRTADPVATAH
jgi:glycosyltransferase involved in cell wall biosynthesis